MSKSSSIIQYGLLGLIVAAAFILMFNASLKESATMDELAHIPSGYGYVKYLDYRLNPEHPPLIKALAAFPLLFQKLNFPVQNRYWQKDVNGQWAVGAQFLYESGNNADEIIQWSRLGPMLLTLLLAIFIYIWSKELIGRWWAFLPTFLFVFSPTVLAHGHYVTTDIGAALGIFIALYYFIKFLFENWGRNFILAGLAFGVAQLMKFSAVLLIPFFVFLLTVFYISKVYHDWNETAPKARLKRFSFRAVRYVKNLFLIFLIGYLLVYAAYFVFTINYPIEKQKSDTEFILSSFSVEQLAEINVWMSGNKILRPFAEYLLGVLMVAQRSGGGNTGYFMGEVSASGWWYYFPAVFILKEPLPSLILIGLALLLSIWQILKSKSYKLKAVINYLGLHFAEFSMISFVVFYWAYSIKSPLNIGIRHILPTIPFIYILIASAFKKWINSGATVIKSLLVAVLIIWYVGETIFVAPNYLSYFNEIGGGTKNGYQYVVDSNYDWGQDLKRLKDWTDKNLPAGRQIAVDYFGGGNPKYYLGDKVEYWQSAKGNPKYEGIDWFAISINNLQGALGQLHPGQSRNPEDEYGWLKEFRNPYQPDAKAGTSIFIYKL